MVSCGGGGGGGDRPRLYHLCASLLINSCTAQKFSLSVVEPLTVGILQ